MQTTKSVEELEDRIVKLRIENSIDNITYNIFIEECERIKKEIAFFETRAKKFSKISGDKIPEERIESLVRDFSILENIVKCIAEGKIDTTREKFILELIMKLENFNKINILIVNNGYRFSPTCFPLLKGNDMSFILLIPKSPEYLSDNLVGLLAHEACHSNKIVKSFTESIFSQERRKIGEMLADVMAYSMVEFAFTYSINYYVQKILNFNDFSEIKSSHPSWSARIKLLNQVTNILWNSDILKERNNLFLQSSIESFSNQKDLEEQIVAKGYKEVNNLYQILANLKLNEYMLENINDLQINDIKEFVQTLLIIKKVVSEC